MEEKDGGRELSSVDSLPNAQPRARNSNWISHASGSNPGTCVPVAACQGLHSQEAGVRSRAGFWTPLLRCRCFSCHLDVYAKGLPPLSGATNHVGYA